MKKMVGMVVACAVLLGGVLPANIGSAKEIDTNNSEETEMVPVVVSSSEDEVIVASVPAYYEEEYLNQLEDESFVNEEIQNSEELASGPLAPLPSGPSTNGGISTFSYVNDGAKKTSTTVKYFRRAEVLKMIDHFDNSFAWQTYVSNPLGDAALGAAIKWINKSNIIAGTVAALAWSSGWASLKAQSWWRDSAIKILRGHIYGVKLTVKPSGKSYPAAYITLTRY